MYLGLPVCTHTYITELMKKEAMNRKESREGCLEEFKGESGKREMI